ncbi:MAG: hypothetical protein LBO82_06055 [Synergistaceae bacterium]|jgi:hypothetical protein|nr:hypothetical protein [Synergistaceae bacterium]
MSTPKAETPSVPPRIETVDVTENKAASKAAELRRRQAALSRSDTMAPNGVAGGSMAPAGTGKKKLGE